MPRGVIIFFFAIGCRRHRRLFIEIMRSLFGGLRPAIPVACGGEEGKKEHNANFDRNLNKHTRHEINGNVSGSIERGTGTRARGSRDECLLSARGTA